MKRHFAITLLFCILFTINAFAQVVQILDPNLREAIREQLQLPAGTPITQQDMQKLEYLDNEKTEKMGITDLTGLEYATNLSSIPLNQNEITDLSPLSNLIQLESLGAWGNPISDISPLAKLTNLRFIDLGSCDIADIIPLSNLTKLQTLQLGWNHLIQDISPLANLTNLKSLHLNHSRIVDISPLSNLIQLEVLVAWSNPISDISPLAKLTNLRFIDLSVCDIADITPLSNLTKLQTLKLGWNYLIQDISPLADLTNLKSLHLNGNRIVDIRPLANLTQLKELFMDGNRIGDFSPLDGLSLDSLRYDEICELPYLPVQERLQNRTFPSIFAAWRGVVNSPEPSDTEHIDRHDLYWDGPHTGLDNLKTPKGWRLGGTVREAQEYRDSLFSLNPNMIFLAEVRVRDVGIGYYPEDFPYWLRDENGNPVKSPSGNVVLTDFTQPGMQDIVVGYAVAVAECGLFDGIFFDWFAEWGTVLHGYYSYEEEQRAKDKILQRIRAQVRDDFLIIINTNRTKIPRRAWGINGTFMETLRDNQWDLSIADSYTHTSLIEIEDTLLWVEEHLREPQVNCLEGWGIPTEPPDSPNNRRWMRVFTTMSLIHSNGYVLYNNGTVNPEHRHIWYDFWDADLGRPIGSKAQPYQDIEGLFIREYTNGWAVYNRSGNEQAITLPRVSTGVSSTKQDITHLLPDLDGEIYLRKGKPYDLNRDGTVNILDLIIVSQHFGTNEADINGDSTTNILDLTLVAQQLR